MAPGRSRVYIPALIALVVAIIGGYAWASSSDDRDERIVTEAAENCPPIARDDVAATLPTEPVTIDVLANDSDADDDALVFSTERVSEGAASIDDGGTPTDAADDRLVYTPRSFEPASLATIIYRLEDTAGASSTARVTIAINDTASLPASMQPVEPGDPTTTQVDARCAPADQEPSTSTSTGESTTTSTSVTTDEPAATGSSSLGGFRRTVRNPSPSTGTRSTTTTMRRTTTTTGRSNVSPPPSEPSGPAPTEPRQTTTTRPRSSSSTSEPPCDDPQSCRDYGNGFRPTTTTRP